MKWNLAPAQGWLFAVSGVTLRVPVALSAVRGSLPSPHDDGMLTIIAERKKQVKAQGWWAQLEGPGQALAPTIGPIAPNPISREPSSLEGLSDKSDNESDMDNHEDGNADKAAGQKRGGLWYVHPDVCAAATNGQRTHGFLQLPR